MYLLTAENNTTPEFDTRIRWYCIRSQIKREHITADQLKQSLGIEVFSARLRYPKMTRRGKVIFIEPLFPGYFFARCDEETLQLKVKNSRGVTGIVHFGKNIPYIPDETIESLNDWLKNSQQNSQNFEKESIIDLALDIAVGQNVEIINGPLAGMSGEVVQIKSSLERLDLLMEILGSEQIISIEISQLLISHKPLEG